MWKLYEAYVVFTSGHSKLSQFDMELSHQLFDRLFSDQLCVRVEKGSHYGLHPRPRHLHPRLHGHVGQISSQHLECFFVFNPSCLEKGTQADDKLLSNLVLARLRLYETSLAI